MKKLRTALSCLGQAPVIKALVLPFLVASLIAASPAAPSMPDNPARDRTDWWKRAVIYEIYPRSFADSDNDGIGDIRGITAHLDYVRALGIDAIWMTPMFPSPQVDFGYDVSNYNAVDPQFGTLSDVDRLIAEGKQRGIKLILDFVINHTSSQHPWFVQARSSRTNRYRNFYVWRDPKPEGAAPSNWVSYFGGSAWTYDPVTKQSYYHFFYPEQPDLNWRNPEVEKAMFAAARWWLKRGVYGLRLDAVDSMYERADLADNLLAEGTAPYGEPNQHWTSNDQQPEIHPELQRMRRLVADPFPGRVLVGETWPETVEGLTRYYGPHNDELHLPMFLSLISVNPITAQALRARIEAIEANPVGGWPCWALSNHDYPRVATRFPIPAGATSDDMAKLTGALLLTLRGTPVLNYGEELGMVNHDPMRREDVKDIIGVKGWPKEKGRDGERTPMQWDASPNAGFNRGAAPWLPVGADYASRNVAAARADPGSVLNFYRRLIALRRTHPALSGSFVSVNRNDSQVFGFQRTGGGKTVLVLLNFDAKPARVRLTDASAGQVRSVLAANRARQSTDAIDLQPLGVFVAEVGP